MSMIRYPNEDGIMEASNLRIICCDLLYVLVKYFSDPSTYQTWPCLASEIRWDRVHSGWYGRRLSKIFKMKYLLSEMMTCVFECILY